MPIPEKTNTALLGPERSATNTCSQWFRGDLGYFDLTVHRQTCRWMQHNPRLLEGVWLNAVWHLRRVWYKFAVANVKRIKKWQTGRSRCNSKWELDQVMQSCSAKGYTREITKLERLVSEKVSGEQIKKSRDLAASVRLRVRINLINPAVCIRWAKPHLQRVLQRQKRKQGISASTEQRASNLQLSALRMKLFQLLSVVQMDYH